MTMIPGERKDQYRRNLVRASGSVAMARVSVLKTDSVSLIASARIVQAIFTYPGSLNAANWSGGKARNVTFASQGLVTAPTTIWRSGTLGQHTPPERLCLREEPTRMPASIRRCAEEDLTSSDHGSHHG